MSDRTWNFEAHGSRRRRQTASVFAALAGVIQTYRRYIRAGSEIEDLLRLSDAQLAARGLTREGVARRTFAKHGINLDRGRETTRGPDVAMKGEERSRA